jgi:hypothetical protein
MRIRLGRADRPDRHHHPASRDDLVIESSRWRFDPNLPLLDHTPSADQISAWIDALVAEGVRRPGEPADAWTEAWLLRELTALGLEDVTAEPVTTSRWRPGSASLEVRPERGTPFVVDGFPVPGSRRTSGLTARIARPGERDVRGAIAMQRVDLTATTSSSLRDSTSDWFDPEGAFDHTTEVLPVGHDINDVMGPAQAGDAVAFVGALGAEGWDTRDLYLPFDGISRSMPGIWITPADAARIELVAAEGPVEATLRVEATVEAAHTSNVIGVLPGASEHWVVIGAHRGAPWSSAVHASGVAMVLAQAALWARLPVEERPHNLCFVLSGGAMPGDAGTDAFVQEHAAMLEGVLLAVHLHNVGVATEVVDGRLIPLPQPANRWWFASENAALHDLLGSAIRAEHLGRSLVFRPDVFAEHPPSDGAPFLAAGVPIVDLMPLPRYLLSASDTIEMVHRPSLVPITRAVARLVWDLKGMTPAVFRYDAMR